MTKNNFARTLPVLLLLIAQRFSHECIHTKIMKKIGSPGVLSVEPEEGRKMQNSAAYRPIRIYTDYTNVKVSDPVAIEFITEVLSKQLVARLQSFISVTGPTTIPRFSKTDCEDLSPTPASFASQTTDADLILIVGTIDESSDYVAYAAPCSLSSSDRRPIVGIININIRHLSIYKDKINIYLSMMLHEVMHVLVLSPGLYDFYTLGKGKAYTTETRTSNAGTATVYKLITPGLVAAGRTHFNCASFSGMYLENEGSEASAGAHFEKVYAGNELMTAQATGRMILSFWILNLLNDSGWYKVDFNKAEALDWGKNKGCGFLSSDCNSAFSEFCSTQGKNICSADYQTKTTCTKTSFSDTCLIIEPLTASNCNQDYVNSGTALYETFGAGSRCFQVLSNGRASAGCYPVRCNGATLQITLGQTALNCTTSGQQLSYQDLTITCPNITDFCQRLNGGCINDCSGFGKCLISGECYCDYFHAGADCSTAKNCTLTATTCQRIQETSEATSVSYKAATVLRALIFALSVFLASQLR